MAVFGRWEAVLRRSAPVGYAVAVAFPVAITLLAAWLSLPPFVFEHVIILIVIGVAIPWGFAPAVLAACVAVVGDDLLLREPIGVPTITGVRDVLDFGLFVAVAAIVAALVSRTQVERERAEHAAERERHAREERDRLIATVAHDLATPLSVLSGTVQFARLRGPGIEADLPRLLMRLETATSRATSLLRTLADAHALDTDDFALRTELIDVRAVVSEIAEMMDRLSDRHPVVLALPDTPVVVRGDVDRLQRVVENLIGNAIKYSPDGGVVEVSVTVENGRAVLTVRDYGIGISDEALPHIFRRAYRAPGAQAIAPGLGLGLNIAAQIVAHHGGRIDVRRAESRGTIVLLSLPLSAPARGAVPVGAGPAATPLRPAGPDPTPLADSDRRRDAS